MLFEYVAVFVFSCAPLRLEVAIENSESSSLDFEIDSALHESFERCPKKTEVALTSKMIVLRASIITCRSLLYADVSPSSPIDGMKSSSA